MGAAVRLVFLRPDHGRLRSLGGWVLATVLGVSMAPASIQMVLLDGENADGPRSKRTGSMSPPPRRERSRSGDRRHPGHPRGRGRRAPGTLVDRGSWTDRHEAAVLRDALAARQINNVMLVPALRAHRGAVRGARHRDDSTRGNLRRLRRRRPPGEHPTPSPTTRTSRTLGRRWPGSMNRNRPRAGCSWSAPVPTSPRCGRRPGRGCQSLDLRHRGPFRPPMRTNPAAGPPADRQGRHQHDVVDPAGGRSRWRSASAPRLPCNPLPAST